MHALAQSVADGMVWIACASSADIVEINSSYLLFFCLHRMGGWGTGGGGGGGVKTWVAYKCGFRRVWFPLKEFV